MLTVVHWVPSTSLSEALRSRLMVKENGIPGKGSFFIEHPRVRPAGPHSKQVTSQLKGGCSCSRKGNHFCQAGKKNLDSSPSPAAPFLQA